MFCIILAPFQLSYTLRSTKPIKMEGPELASQVRYELQSDEEEAYKGLRGGNLIYCAFKTLWVTLLNDGT